MSPAFAGALFISFEGVEGSGKTLQIERLRERLIAAGLDVVTTREPGGTELGRRLRSLLLAPDEPQPHATAELLLYVADRVQHLVEVIEPALSRGAVVLCDRYLDATLAYQGHGRGLDLSLIRSLHDRAPLDRRPERTVLLDLDPEDALERARARNAGRGLDATEGRFERERMAFHRRVRQGYLDLAREEPRRIRRVDARGTPEQVERRVGRALADLIPSLVGETR